MGAMAAKQSTQSTSPRNVVRRESDGSLRGGGVFDLGALIDHVRSVLAKIDCEGLGVDDTLPNQVEAQLVPGSRERIEVPKLEQFNGDGRAWRQAWNEWLARLEAHSEVIEAKGESVPTASEVSLLPSERDMLNALMALEESKFDKK